MYDTWRERRRTELTGARSLDLLRLVMLYRDAVGLDLYQQLPENLSFQQMVDTIASARPEADRRHAEMLREDELRSNASD